MVFRFLLKRWRGQDRRSRLGKERRRRRFPLFVEPLEDRILLSLADRPAFLLLDPTGKDALEAAGNGLIEIAGGAGVVNSSSPSAVEVQGRGSLNVGELDIVGSPGTSVSGHGEIIGTIHTGIAPQADPLASLRVPDQPAMHFQAEKFSGDLYPGTYENGIHVSGQASVILHPGVYYLKGGLDVSGGANVRGDGVTLYVSPGEREDGLGISGQAVVTLSPPTGGVYQGVTFFQARTVSAEVKVAGNGSRSLVGTVYAAHGELEVSGNCQVNGGGDSVNLIGSQFIGYDMDVEGNGKVLLDAGDFNSVTLTASLSPAPVALPDGTLLTNVRNSAVTGKTSPQAAVALETDGDGLFDEGSTTADASGNYTLPVTLREGPNTLQVRATANGQQVTQTVQVTLDTVAPTIAVTAPAAGLVTNQNVTFVGQVSDERSGVASLQAALDGGAFAAVSFDAGGEFRFATALPLDHTADGPHTEHLCATDLAGNVSTFDVPLTLDTVAPTVSVTSPAPDLVTNRDVTFSRRFSHHRSCLWCLEDPLDCGAFAAVSFDAGGNFSFLTGLPLDGSADGRQTVRLRATDRAGNVGTAAPFSFTLDTTAPAVDFHLDPASDTPADGDRHTQEAVVTLTGTTEPNTPVVLEETGARTTSDPTTGSFSFPGVALALGDNPFTVRATDQAGNTSSATHTVTRDGVVNGNRLVEGTRFLTAFERTFVVPAQRSELQLRFKDLTFDTRAAFIKDAFEASLTDADGNPLVLPIAGTRDAFFNITEGQAPVLSPNARLTGDTVDVDLSHIPAGTQAKLRVRLVNNDADSTTSVSLEEPEVIAAAMGTPGAVTPAAAAAAAPGGIDFAGLADVTTSVTAAYGQTSFNEKTDVLFAGLALKNTGSYPVDAPLVAVITHLSDPSVRVRNSDGLTPEGLPYFDLSGSVAGGTLAPGQSTGARTLAFFDPNGVSFTYDLVMLGHLNKPPAFTSEPYTEAIPGVPYVYQATAVDADHDTLTYSLVTGPDGMTVDRLTGKVTWSPQSSDLGNQAVLLQVDDGHGGTARQQYTVSVITAPPNRPPVFTSTPVVDAQVNMAYRYQAQSTDPDGNAPTFALVSGPAGLSVDRSTGRVSWTPAAAQLGTQAVTLRVADDHDGSAVQVYQVRVGNQPGNTPPVFVSEPPTQFNLPGQSNPPSGRVDPTRVDLNLGRGDSSTQTVSLTVPATGAAPKVDVFLLLDDTGSFGPVGPAVLSQFPAIIAQLRAALPDVDLGFGVGRFEEYANFALQDGVGRPFILNQPIIASTAPGFDLAMQSALNRSAPGDGGDNPESFLEGLYQTATGAGFDGNGDGDRTDSGPATLVGTQTNPGNSGDVPPFGTAGDPVRYHFRLLDLASQPSLALGTPVTSRLDPDTQSSLYTFTGTAGQRLFFDNLSLSQAGGRWALYGPGNELIDSKPLGTDFEVNVPATGTYTLVLAGDGTQPPIDDTFQALLAATTTTPLALDTLVTGAIASPRQRDQYTFTLAGDSLLYFDALTNDANLTWSLAGPAGNAVSGRAFTSSDAGGISSNPVLNLFAAGDYTLTVERTGDGTGAYQFALWDLRAAAPLTPGAPVNGSLSPANETDLYRFPAAAGDRFFFDAQTLAGAPGATWRFIDPYGNVLFNTPFADVAALTVPQLGTYMLLVEGGIADTGTGTYAFT